MTQDEASQGEAGRRIANFDVLAIWDDRNNDPLNFLVGMVPPALREFFPAAIEKSALLASARLPADLPTAVDRTLWTLEAATPAGAAQNTLGLLRQFDGLELFRPLPPEIILKLGKKSYTVQYAAGETLVWQGEFNNDIFILLEGQLETSVQGSSRNAAISPGELFGEIAWLTQGVARRKRARARGLGLPCHQGAGPANSRLPEPFHLALHRRHFGAASAVLPLKSGAFGSPHITQAQSGPGLLARLVVCLKLAVAVMTGDPMWHHGHDEL